MARREIFIQSNPNLAMVAGLDSIPLCPYNYDKSDGVNGRFWPKADLNFMPFSLV
jgi:hypothetical protein